MRRSRSLSKAYTVAGHESWLRIHRQLVPCVLRRLPPTIRIRLHPVLAYLSLAEPCLDVGLASLYFQ